MDMWSILGIPYTSDVNAIRKAYTMKVKEYHPEEHPKEFQQINEAYRTAVAEATRQDVVKTSESTESLQKIGNGFSFDFPACEYRGSNNLDKSALDVLSEMLSLTERKEPRLSVWKSFLHSERFSHVMDDPLFIGEFTNLLRKELDSFKHALCKQIRRIYFSDGQRDPTMSPYRQLFLILEKRKSHFKRRFPTFKSFFAYYSILIYILIGFILLTILFAIGLSYDSGNNDTSTNEQPIMTMKSLDGIFDDTARITDQGTMDIDEVADKLGVTLCVLE